MLSESTVLKAIVECMDEEHNVRLLDIRDSLKCDDESLFPFLNDFKRKRYIIQSTDSAYVTTLCIERYNELASINKTDLKSMSARSAKFTFSRFFDVGITEIATRAIATIIKHFGW